MNYSCPYQAMMARRKKEQKAMRLEEMKSDYYLVRDLPTEGSTEVAGRTIVYAPLSGYHLDDLKPVRRLTIPEVLKVLRASADKL